MKQVNHACLAPVPFDLRFDLIVRVYCATWLSVCTLMCQNLCFAFCCRFLPGVRFEWGYWRCIEHCVMCVLFRADEATIPKSTSCSHMVAGCFDVHWYIVGKLLYQESVMCIASGQKKLRVKPHLTLLLSFVTVSSLALGCSWEHALKLWHRHHNHWEHYPRGTSDAMSSFQARRQGHSTGIWPGETWCFAADLRKKACPAWLQYFLLLLAMILNLIRPSLYYSFLIDSFWILHQETNLKVHPDGRNVTSPPQSKQNFALPALVCRQTMVLWGVNQDRSLYRQTIALLPAVLYKQGMIL